MPQVFVSGTWRDIRAKPYADQASYLGRRLAELGLDLACGPGTGIARYVIDGYRSISPRGNVKYYLPGETHMLAVGEEVAQGADLVEQTPFDYPMRNVYQISKSDGVFILTGGDGALEEALPALIDYGIPVAVIEDSGEAAEALRRLLGVFPEWQKLLSFAPDVGSIVDSYCEQVVKLSGQRKATLPPVIALLFEELGLMADHERRRRYIVIDPMYMDTADAGDVPGIEDLPKNIRQYLGRGNEVGGRFVQG